jgi:glucosamine kinase
MKNVGDTEQLFIGVDGGGTKCRACLYTSDLRILGSGLGGPSNPFHGEAQAQASIVKAIEMALVDAKLPVSTIANLIVGAGLAGVNVPAVFKSMSAWQHPFKKLYLTTDLHIACIGAHSQNKGAVIVCGTGSCGYSFINGEETMIGGHGFLLGDKGSGAWLGLEAIKAMLLAHDNLGPATMLRELISSYLSAEGIMVVEKLSAATSSNYAKLASFVFEAAKQNDEVATNILREGAAYIDAVAEQLWAKQPSRMSLIGGLSELIIPWLKPSVVANLSPPINPPELGAVYFAQQRHSM